jgi:predicted TIM-barrel fold metal-dependent hydrolase
MSADDLSISSFPIVDAHHHLWDLSNPNHHYKLLRHEASGDHVAGDFNRLKSTYSIKDYLNDTQPYHVVKSVHVAASYDRDIDPWGDLKWLEKQPETNENRLPNAFVAYANLTDTQLEEKFTILTSQFKNVRGVRHMLNWLDDKASIYTMCDRPDYLTDDKWKKGFSLLNKYGLSFDLQIYQHQMNDAAQLAREHLNTKIVLNHCGKSNFFLKKKYFNRNC